MVVVVVVVIFHNKSLTPLEIDNNKYADVSTVFLQSSSGQKRKEFSFFKLFCFSFSFSFLFCPDDDCRKTVETSAYLLLSISSGVNDL